MKILFLSENFPPETNAAATRVHERAVYWARWGHEVTVITCAPNFPHGKLMDGYRNRWYQTEEMAGIRVVRVKTFISANRGVARRALDFLSFGVSGTIAGIFQPRFDVVAATSPQFLAAVAGWAVGAVRRRPFVFELGDIWPGSIAAVGAVGKGWLLGLLEKIELFLYARAAVVAALTHAFKRNLVARGVAPDHVAVVLGGVDLPRYGPRARDPELAREWGLENKFVVGYVGTHGMAHALSNVLAAADTLRDAADLRFLFVGAGAERDQLMAEKEARGLTNVVFAPPQPKSAMPRVWSLCDAALVHLKDSPTFAEVIPSKIFEAMASGLPIVLAAPAGEAGAIVEKHAAGLWVPAEKPDLLAAAVRRLMADADGRVAMAQAALTAAPEYSRETQAQRMLDVFAGVCGGG